VVATNDISPNLRAALELASIGLRVFPANGSSKKPCVKAWQQVATTDRSTIEAWWRSYPDAVPALPAGGNNLLGVDLDVKNGKDGISEWRAIYKEHPFDWSAHPVVQTPSGGQHIYFRQRTGFRLKCSVGLIASGIDLRGDGGYLIAPGACLANGSRYDRIHGDMGSIPEVPDKIYDFLLAKLQARKRDAPSPPPNSSRPTGQSRIEVTAHQTAYAAKALEYEAAELANMLPGSGRNDALNRIGHRMGRFAGAGWIERQVVEEALMKASEENGYIAKDGGQAARRTFESGFKAGVTDPHPPLAEGPVGGSIGNVFYADLARHASPSATGKIPAMAGAGPIVRRVSDVPAEPIVWIWPQRIAVGKLSIIAGDPGLGKSQLTAFLAAKVTTGGQWPNDEGHATTGSVIILSCEDDIGDTIRPRLEAVGADLEKVHVIEAIRTEQGGRRGFSIKRDMLGLAKALTEIGDVVLVVIDPITAYLDGADTHNTGDVRAALAPLQDMAAQHRVAVVAVSHLNKNSGNGKSINAITGSNAFVAASRSVLLVTKDDGRPGRRLLAEVKNNLGNAATLAFNIRTGDVGDGITAPFVVFEEGVVEVTADEALSEALSGNSGGTLSEARQFLTEELSQGPMPASQLIAAAKHAEISEKKLRRSATDLGVIKKKGGYQGVWMWSLPSKDDQRWHSKGGGNL
jgi:putative DNA primase/helicase